MALRQSVSTSQTANHAAAATVPSTQSSQFHTPLHSPALTASLKTAGVIIFVVLCALIVMSARASGKNANDQFNTANEGATSSLNVQTQSVDQKSTASGNDASAGSTSASVQATTSSNSEGGTSVDVSVNGQPVDVPDNGNYQKTITSPDGSTTTLNVSSSSDGSASTHSNTSTHVDVRSNSTTNGSTSTRVKVNGTGGTN
jgi:hypothetical protein